MTTDHPISSPAPGRLRGIWSFVSFEAGWAACVFSAAKGAPGLGILAVGALVALHLWLSARRQREAILVCSVGLAGGLIDTLIIGTGAFTFPGNMHPALAPIFLTALYLNFATTLRPLLGWLAPRPALAAVLGALGGPLAYYAGARFGAIQLHANLWFGLGFLALAWAVQTPVYLWLSTWLHRERLLKMP